ncbi:MAG: acyltransferase family protein [Chitinophagales bacterium]
MLSYLSNKFRRITTNQLYLPELDGMRFLSLSLVTLFHIRGYFLEKTNIQFADNPKDYYWLNRFFVNADRSVPLFFAISGFILCLPFAHHYINHGKKISLKQYYLRRVTRLEPPYFIVMICIFLAQLALGTNTFHVLFPSLLASLIYSHNFIFHHSPLVTVVAWTLEVEIQYYILAPYLFRLLTLPKIVRRCLIASLIIFFVMMQYLYPPSFLSIYGSIQHFLIGILIADFYVCGFAIDFFKKGWITPLAAVVFLIMFFMPRWEYYPYPSRLPLAILFPFMIGLFYYIILRNETVKKVFSYKFIPIIGGMCYTTYLIHYTVISMLGRFTVNIHFTNYYLPNLILQFILLIIPILLIASVFYLYIERPFMSKKWIEKLMKKNKKREETNMQAEVDA